MGSVFFGLQQGGTSLSTPKYKIWEAITNFTSVAAVNPLDDNLAHPFNRIIGQQTLTVRNLTTGFIWTLELAGGSNALSNGFVGSFDVSANYIITARPVGCMVESVNFPPPISTRVNRYRVTTMAPDNRSYLLEYSPFPNVNPLITLEAPDTLAGNSLELKTQYVRPV